MLAWGIWQIAVERRPRPPLLLAAGGLLATILLVPFLWELTHSTSKMQGGRVFGFFIREMIPPDGLLTSPLFHNIVAGHYAAARVFVDLLLLAPSYAIELGFSFLVLLIYLVPAWRGRKKLTPEQRALVFMAVVTLAIISFIRSWVLNYNDFGWRVALLAQFPLLLLSSEVLTSWSLAKEKGTASEGFKSLPFNTPRWVRSITALALFPGILGTLYLGFMFRFHVPLVAMMNVDPEASRLSHNAYISNIGYAQLDRVIPRDAVVQFNPVVRPVPFWASVDLVGVNHQIAIETEKPWCGSELGGDPSGCAVMAPAIGAIYEGGTVEQARTICREHGIQYLVARIYDPVWNERQSWVWRLPLVVTNEEFRALDCR